MKHVETEKVELKRALNAMFEKEIVSFLNTHHGTIYIGIKDDERKIGVDRLDESMRKIADIITNQIAPNPGEFITVKALFENNKLRNQ